MVRLALGWTLLVASIIGWGLSLVGILGKGEPVFVLSLSWLAITLTALDIIFTASVHRQRDHDDHPG